MQSRSNCLFFALCLLWRRKGRKRGLVIRQSRLGSMFPHVLYVELRHYGWREIHYIPTNAEAMKLPPPLFEGRSKWGDS